MAGRLFRYLISFCHECNYHGDFNLSIKNYKENMHIITYRCPKCHKMNEVVADKEQLDDYFGRKENK